MHACMHQDKKQWGSRSMGEEEDNREMLHAFRLLHVAHTHELAATSS